MNSMIMDIILDNENSYIKYQTINSIKVQGECNLNLFNNSITNLTIEVLDNSRLDVNYFSNNNSNSSIIINAHKNSEVNFNHSYVNKDKYDLDISTDFKSTNSVINVSVCGINDGGKSTINVGGYVKSKRINNILNESIKIININNGSVFSNPNMYIDTSKVEANHSNSIGTIRDDELFYLMSKGINKEESIKLISNGFILNNIKDNELINDILKILN